MTRNLANPTSQVILFAVLCALIMLLNGIFFPLAMTPDSYGYLGTSETISRIWRAGGSLDQISEKFRILGYPSLIAILELMFGSRPFLPVYVVQAFFVVASGTILFWTLLRFRLASLWATLLSLLYVAALPTMLSSFLLTDTMSNCLTAIAVCLLVVPLFETGTPALLRAVMAGLMMGCAFFFREANQYLVVCLLPIALFTAWQRRKVGLGVAMALALTAPVLLAGEAYKSFNEVRFGKRFVTTGGRTVMLHAVLPLAKRKPGLFGGSDPLDMAAREILNEYAFAETLNINAKLLAEGIDQVQVSRAAWDKYAQAWRQYPLGMFRVVLERSRIDKQGTELLNPLLAFYNNNRWRSDIDKSESKRMRIAIRTGDFEEFIRVLPITAGRIPSLIVFVVFLLGSPLVAYMAWRRGERNLSIGLAGLLISYAGYVFVYSLVNMEMRYLAGIAVILVLGSAKTASIALGWMGWSGFARTKEES
jgi:hypothetical protein